MWNMLSLRPCGLLLFLLVVTTFQDTLAKDECNKPHTLYIHGFIPALNNVYTSETIVPAADVAIAEINNQTDLLPDYCLSLEFSNTQCNPTEATLQLSRSVLNETKIMFLGGGCTLATEPLAALSGRVYRTIMVSYGASTPSLSGRTVFPRFFRTLPSEIQSNSARLAIMRKFGWSRVAAIHLTVTYFSLVATDIHISYNNLFNNTEEDELTPRSFTDDPEIPLRQVKERDIRIILGFFYENSAKKALCQAYHMGLATDNHVWMLPSWYTKGWWNTTVEGDSPDKTCTAGQMRKAVIHNFFYDAYAYGDDPNAATFSGTDNATFFEKYQPRLDDFNANSPFANDTSPHEYVTFTYDAVYAMAIALNKTENDLRENGGGLSLRDFSYTNEHNISEMIQDHMAKTNFTGLSGEVTFDINGSRVGVNAIYQLRECDPPTDDLCLDLVAIHNPGPNGDNYDFEFMNQPTWGGGSPPQDRSTPKNIYLNQELIYACDVLVTIAIIIAIGLFVFNLATIKKPLIADSAPFINMIIILGCILVLGTCYLFGIDSATPRIDSSVEDNSVEVDDDTLQKRDDRYSAVCMARLWLLTIGFTLSFGALFAKTWQVYRVYTDPKKKKEPFKMWNFLILMGIFLTIDVVYLSMWTGAFPFERGIQTDEDTGADVVENYEECDCDNFGYLIGILYVYKALLVVSGLFLAYESRNVKYIHINDSRFVSIAMYIVVLPLLAGSTLSLVLATELIIDIAYSLAVFMIIISCMSCLLILYIPKFIYMAKGLDTMVQDTAEEDTDGGLGTVMTDDITLGNTPSKDRRNQDDRAQEQSTDIDRGEDQQAENTNSEGWVHVLFTGEKRSEGDPQQVNSDSPTSEPEPKDSEGTDR